MTRDSLLAVERRLSASGPDDRELVSALMTALGFEKRSFTGRWFWWMEGGPFWLVDKWNPLSSIDAALALVSRVLPEGWWCVDGSGEASVVAKEIGGGHSVDSHAATPALAICLALCRALLAKETE